MGDSKILAMIFGIGCWIYGHNEIRMAKRLIKNSKKNKKVQNQQ